MSSTPDRPVSAATKRKPTPRVPANFLYARLIPISIVVLVVVLVVIMGAILISLFVPLATY